MFDLFLAFSFIFGTMIGSFLNCLVWRLYRDESLWTRSHCPRCDKQIAWYDNIPLASFLSLGARCRHCKEKISFEYPLAELALGLLFFFFFWYRFQGLSDSFFITQVTSFNLSTILLLRDWIIVAFLSAIFLMDYKWYVVADEISLPGIIAIFSINLALGFVYPELATAFVWWKLLLAVFVGGAFFSLQYFLSGGRWVGAGDIRIGALMGASLGWPGILVGLALSYGIGAVASIYLIVVKKKQKFDFRHLWQESEPTEEAIIPFGPFLAIGCIIALFYSEVIINWYQNLMF